MNRAPVVLFALLALVDAPMARADDKPKHYEVVSVLDVPYYTGPDEDKIKHKLDIYYPKDLKNYPVLFFVHGGGWTMGDKSQLYGFLASYYAKQGIGVVVTNYRLSPKIKHPEHIKDVARSFAWTYKNIAKYGGDPERMLICGHSAGGHLVALLATDPSYLKDEGVKSEAIKGVIPISGVFRIPDRFVPEAFGTDAALHKNASPLYQAQDKKELPPFLILCADKDFPYCSKKEAEPFQKALTNGGNKAEFEEIKNSDHMKIIFSAANASPVSKAIIAFVEKCVHKP